MIYNKIRRRTDNPLQLAMAPFIDVVFILLIFVVSTSRVSTFYSALKVKNIPKSLFVSHLEEDTLVVSVDEHGDIFIGDKKVTLQDLKTIFPAEAKIRSRAVIVSNSNISLGYVVKIVGYAKSAGFEEVNIGAMKDEN